MNNFFTGLWLGLAALPFIASPATLGGVTGSASGSVGGPLRIDFQGFTLPGMGRGAFNFEVGGLRFSPSCRVSTAESNGERWLQSDHDNDNCATRDDETTPANPNFLGTGYEDFYVDRHGEAFTLHGLAGVGYNGTAFSVVSSRGGIFNGGAEFKQAFDLTGELWTDITWFQLINDNDAGRFGWQPHMGWDDIRYSVSASGATRGTPVPEPATLLLLTPLLLLARRR